MNLTILDKKMERKTSVENPACILNSRDISTKTISKRGLDRWKPVVKFDLIFRSIIGRGIIYNEYDNFCS